MRARLDRLRKLVHVQEQLKALHEMRHARHLFEARAAEEDARQITARFDAEGSLSDLFPELYHRGVGRALRAKQDSDAAARAEQGRIAHARARATIVERAYRETARDVERDAEEKECLETVDRGVTRKRQE